MKKEIKSFYKPTKRICPVCGKKFMPTNRIQKYCTPTCNIESAAIEREEKRKYSRKIKKEKQSKLTFK